MLSTPSMVLLIYDGVKSLGFVKMPKQLSDLSPWARIELTWKIK
jgi:hypothetical protein